MAGESEKSNISILRCYFRLPPMPGGMEIHIAEISRYQGQKHNVTLAYSQGDPVGCTDSIRILPNSSWFTNRVRPWSAFIFYSILLLRIIKDKRIYDIIHIHGDWSSYLLAPLIKKTTKAQMLAFSFHGDVSNRVLHTSLLPKTLSRCDLMLCTGFSASQELSPFCKTVFQPSGVRDIFFMPNLVQHEGSVAQCVTVSVMRKLKNLEVLVQTAQLCPGITFVIIGDGPEKNRLMELAYNSAVSNIHFMGQKSPEEIIEVYKQSQLFIHTGYREGTPTAVMEAMVAGLPVVAAHAPGLEHIIEEGKNGQLIAEGAQAALRFAEVIRDLSFAPQVRQKMAENNRDKGRSFSWNVVANRIDSEIMAIFQRDKK